MAEHKRKSQAEQAAARAKQNPKNAAPKKAKVDSKKTESEKRERKIPLRVISSILFIALFVLFLVIFFNPEGALIKLIEELVYGLFGKTGFVISIPILLYLFYIHAFSGDRPVIMRSVCLTCFILACGCIAHLTLESAIMSDDISLIGELYTGGISGQTGGVICGGFTMLIVALCGRIISYIALVITAILTLLAGMQITIPSIIRAIQNRPRSEFEKEKKPEQEPAAVIVNHIANKRIEHIEKTRRAYTEPIDTVGEDLEPICPTPKKKPDNHIDDILQQIDSDVEAPVTVAVDMITEPQADVELIPIGQPPVTMPVLERTAESDVDVDIDVDVEPILQTKKEKVTAADAEESAAEIAIEIENNDLENEKVEYSFPPIDLLKLPVDFASDGTAEMRENTRRLNETLASFKIEAHIINVTRGPSVTRYEVELEKGVRLNKLTNSADDIALSLGASGVRIAAVPGKISVVGIEVPNQSVTTVSLREVIDSAEFTKAKSRSSFAVGKDIGGNCIVGNIAKLPHMLIAGTTGSGKSVCMNSIILSLLYKATPEEVKLIMVDPKMVELGIYNGIPHLLIPVVTDPKKAAGSLQWAVSEMMRRYKLMSDVGVRDLESYNSIIESQAEEGNKFAQIVVIIDELADLMLVAAKEVEESICRIAQMGRAAGIHLLIATQRPSADVITGLMKANIPSRIAFSVASAMESRIILDTPGAEKLVGKGDMLYAPIGNGKPKRVQGCFVADSEVEAVATYVKSNFTTNYDQQVMEEIEKKSVQKTAEPEQEATAEELDGDNMLPAAVDVILETGQASVSMLQRRLKLGYARAARIVDEMEEKGIVGPFAGSKPREILITKEQWSAMRGGQSEQLGFDDFSDHSGNEDNDPF